MHINYGSDRARAKTLNSKVGACMWIVRPVPSVICECPEKKDTRDHSYEKPLKLREAIYREYNNMHAREP